MPAHARRSLWGALEGFDELLGNIGKEREVADDFSIEPWSATAGPAGRRLAASFSVGLSRSCVQRGSAGRMRVADRVVAASLHDSVSVVAQESAAPGSVEGGEWFEGTDERASQ